MKHTRAQLSDKGCAMESSKRLAHTLQGAGCITATQWRWRPADMSVTG